MNQELKQDGRKCRSYHGFNCSTISSHLLLSYHKSRNRPLKPESLLTLGPSRLNSCFRITGQVCVSREFGIRQSTMPCYLKFQVLCNPGGILSQGFYSQQLVCAKSMLTVSIDYLEWGYSDPFFGLRCMAYGFWSSNQGMNLGPPMKALSPIH